MGMGPATCRLSTAVLAFTVGASVGASAQSASTLRADVVRALARERDLGKIEVAVEEGRIVLRGELPTLWVKTQAIARALKVAGVKEVASELTVAKGENDNEVAARVANVIRTYEHYTIWDDLRGGVRNGVVTLRGNVTSFPDKSRDLTERISKVRGVQELKNELVVLNPSRSDDELRARLAQRIFSHPSFEPLAGAPNPPFHIIVDKSVVTLTGFVQSRIELMEISNLVAHTEGILRVDNQLQTSIKR